MSSQAWINRLRVIGDAVAVSAASLLLVSVAAALEQVNLPDPTRPPTTHQSAVRRLEISEPQQFTVTAIKIDGARRRALINDRLVGVGDRIGEARVLEIKAGAVVVEYLSQRITVAMSPHHIRRPAARR